jgi:hypothetical protein
MSGLGLEFKLTPSFNFIIEATIRYAKVSDHIEEGTLYFYRVATAGEDSYPLLFIRESPPTEAGVFDPREAVINFSGVSLKTGFKIKF